MAIHLLHGESKSTDPFKIREKADELLEGIETEGNLNFSKFDLSESGTSFAEVVISALTVPFLGGARTVVAKNVKAVEKVFKSDSGDVVKSSGISDADVILRSVDQLSMLPEESLLILIEENGHVDKRTAFYRGLKKAGLREQEFKSMWFDPASGDIDQVREYIKSEATRFDIRLDNPSAETFANLVGSSTGSIRNELEKLSLYAGPGGVITSDAVEDVVTPSSEAVIWNLVDSIGYRKPGVAIKFLNELLDNGSPAPYILAMIARQIRLIVKIREATRQIRSRNQGKLASHTREAPFTIRKVLNQINRFPDINYAVTVDLLMETDLHLKRGTMEARLALETLIFKLATP